VPHLGLPRGGRKQGATRRPVNITYPHPFLPRVICMFPVTNSMLPMALNIAVGPLLRLCVFVCVVPLVVRSILDGTWYQSRGVSPSKLGEGGVNICEDRGVV
jgi:hypothetical protein